MAYVSPVLIIDQRTLWVAQGTRPSEESMDWVPRQRPPSDWFDWFFYSTFKDIEDLALFVQHYGMSREITPGQMEMTGEEDGAHIGSIGVLELPVVVYAAGKERKAHFTTRAIQAQNEDTTVMVVWSSSNTQAGMNAVLKIGYKVTEKGESRDGAISTVTKVVEDSVVAYGQNQTWFTLGALTPGAMLDVFVIVDGTNGSHTLNADVYVHQVIVDPEPEA